MVHFRVLQHHSFILKIPSYKMLASILSKASHKLRNSLLTLETTSASEYNETVRKHFHKRITQFL